MRKWHWIGTFAIAIGCYVGYRQFTTPAPDVDAVAEIAPQVATTRQIPAPTNDGDAEPSDTVEPLVVERGSFALPQKRVADFGPAARVVLAPGMRQPPRPDASPEKKLRMPYADE